MSCILSFGFGILDSYYDILFQPFFLPNLLCGLLFFSLGRSNIRVDVDQRLGLIWVFVHFGRYSLLTPFPCLRKKGNIYLLWGNIYFRFDQIPNNLALISGKRHKINSKRHLPSLDLLLADKSIRATQNKITVAFLT